MIKYILKRFLDTIPTFFIIVTMIFFMIRLVPGGPFSRDKVLPEVIKKNIEAKYHLDEPLIKQYFRYLGDIFLKFDLGPSFHYRDWTVNELIARKFPVSFKLGFIAMLIALFFGVNFGIISALKQNKFPDYFFLSLSLIGISTPLFVITPLLIILLARTLKLVPVGGWGSWQQMVIPVLSLATPYLAYITRLTKAGVLENIRKDFVNTAKSKGLPNFTILWKHVLKGSILPVVSFLGPAFAGIVTGSMVVEQICSIPGLGRDFVLSAFNRDYLLISGVLMTYSLLLIIMNMIVDIVYAFLDPRIKYK